jgi:Lon protease-like protein
MSVGIIARTGPSCETSEGRFQAAELQDGKYILAVGNIKVRVRSVLPTDPIRDATIHYYADYWELQRGWEACEDSFEDSGDVESANKMRAAWPDIWDEVADPA